MTIDWAAFTPYASLFGGVLIGVAAAMLVLLNGRVAGISGIVGSLLRPAPGDIAWRVAFIAGLIGAAILAAILGRPATVSIDAGYPLLIVGGLIVGFGTRLGSGCTSGHGVCGISRFSMRSVIATVLFMAAAFVTVFVLRHVLGR
jgi:uncharacterized membrane protein YedE/YeeE